MQNQVKHNQSLFDFTIQSKGTIEALFETAILNNVSITEDLLTGSDLLVSNGIIDKQIVNYFLNKKIVPATALTQTQIQTLEPQGIGYMIIANDFIVS
ncbi:hypothetical protein [Flavobacterium oreochromis]|uniref:Uncharacterized protein n=1 Tax=Flavobacterium columnare TaxID=996 RepID=A0A246G9T7_9FLAO|nr:hypothetical protein [Flavobacterium oreochromis]OWP76526.1 hypothetical protein BWK62_09315 [Flavobacterium oreochromis]